MKRTLLSIFFHIGTIITLVINVVLYLIGSALLSFHVDYSQFNDYQTITITIGNIVVEDEQVVIEQLNFTESYYVLEGQNLVVFVENGGLDSIQVGNQITLIYGRHGWGDSSDYPIVMIEKEGITFLNYETGVSNLIAVYQSLKNRFYRTMIVPFSILIAFGVGSTYLIVTKRDYIDKNTPINSKPIGN
ncbi:MAG: hypothetical protein EP317_05705 [Bacillota bacterium]|nr:MAG: hypothetical protein EP317_05705 [Bacillota bacterium]